MRTSVFRLIGFVIVAAALSLTGCDPAPQESLIRVRVRVDGQERILSASEPMSVRQLLQKENIRTGDLDRLNPSDFTPIVDGMVITIVRVENRSECLEEEVPYATETLKTPDLAPGVSRVLRPGVSGSARLCFDVIYEDGAEKSRVQSSRTILTPPVSQIMAVGVDSSRIEPIPITGMIVYLSGGQARYVTEISTTQGTLPTGGGLDGQVFAGSVEGRWMLYTRKPDPPREGTQNELWVLLNTGNPDAEPVKLVVENILTADWIPSRPFTFSYSTLQPRSEPPGYQALNDLYIARLDSASGKIIRADPIISPSPLSVYGLWGTRFAWSPDGTRLAWGGAEGAGVVNLEKGAYERLISFSVYTTTLSNGWLWLPSLSWSADSALLSASVHGQVLAGESAETSPVFNLAALSGDGRFQVPELRFKTGMWAAPQYAPLPELGIAYLQARNPIDSVSSEYDLTIADRDGSNARVLFPGKDRPGIRPLDDGSDIAWSPDGRQIAVVYQGDVYVVEVASSRATVITVVGDAQHPRWLR